MSIGGWIKHTVHHIAHKAAHTAGKVLKAGEKEAQEAGDVIIAGESNKSIDKASEPDTNDLPT